MSKIFINEKEKLEAKITENLKIRMFSLMWGHL